MPEEPSTDSKPTAPSMRVAEVIPPPPPSTDPETPDAFAASLDRLREEIQQHRMVSGEYQLRNERHAEETDKALGALAVNALKTNATNDSIFKAVSSAMTMAAEALAAVKVMADSKASAPPVPIWSVYALTGTMGGILVVLVFIAATMR